MSYIKIFELDFKYSFPVSLGHDPKPYNKQLSELRYSGIKTEGAPSLLEVIRYICRNSNIICSMSGVKTFLTKMCFKLRAFCDSFFIFVQMF